MLLNRSRSLSCRILMTRRMTSVFKQIVAYLLGLYVIVSAIYLLGQGRQFIRFQKTKVHHQKPTTTEATSTARSFSTITYGPNCYKENKNQTYKVCTKLPFTQIRCGPDVSHGKKENNGSFLVPDVVFFVWFGDSLKFHFFNYLALRSAAAIHQPERIDFYYSISLPVGKHWERTLLEIPCLNLVRILEPQTLAGRKIPHAVQRTDVARLRILMKYGGIYIDGDAITLKSLDPLRIYPATVGRATQENVCICIAMSRKNSLFIKEYYKHIIFNLPGENSPLLQLFTRFLGEFVQDTLVKVHIEESAINRPNPHVPEDGRFGTTLRRMDISENYFLHLHTGSLYRNVDLDPSWINWDEETLRKLDGVFGEAARIALFGSSDLIFTPDEETQEMQQKIKIHQFKPITQRNAIIEDKEKKERLK